jgi:hypothetical protein
MQQWSKPYSTVQVAYCVIVAISVYSVSCFRVSLLVPIRKAGLDSVPAFES